MSEYGVTFNEWTEAYHKYGTEWLKDQMMVLGLALHNAKQLDKHYSKPQSDDIGEWKWK